MLELTIRHGDEDVRRALEVGARGYVLRSSPWLKVTEAIDAMARGSHGTVVHGTGRFAWKRSRRPFAAVPKF